MKDKNENFLKINDHVTDKFGIKWKIENVNGITRLIRYDMGRRVQTKVLAKENMNEYEKSSHDNDTREKVHGETQRGEGKAQTD